jgi:cysteinyl-tRNA synthetase
MNITDLDDKTINGSEKAGLGLSEFTGKHIETFMKDLDILRIKPADSYPKVSEHVEDMISLAGKLVKKGYAYEKLRSLYFDISRFADYGKLSGINIDKIKVGATVDLDEYEKDNPRDFTLLKRARLSELKRGIYTPTDWGNVRPSWHIQCAAISMKYLGETFDIHTSGRELVFPHHENEIAISKALTGKTPAKYWMHCERVLPDGKKADETKEKISLTELLEMGYTGREIRYWLISNHYRKPVVFSAERLEDARHSLKRLDMCVRSLSDVRDGEPYPEIDQLLYDIKSGFTDAMDDDLNISAALSSIFGIVRKINVLMVDNRIDSGGASKIIEAFRHIDSVLNIFEFSDRSFDPEVKRLVKEREKAREEKNWVLADGIREKLAALGVKVRDHKI